MSIVGARVVECGGRALAVALVASIVGARVVECGEEDPCGTLSGGQVSPGN